jgi:hypothetical protein
LHQPTRAIIVSDQFAVLDSMRWGAASIFTYAVLAASFGVLDRDPPYA